VLGRCPSGIQFGAVHLGQQPTLALADPSELSFAHMVDRLLVGWGDPLHRGLIIRLMSLVATVLTRNPELEFPSCLNLEELVGEASGVWRKDRGEAEEEEVGEELAKQEQGVVDSYLGRAVVNRLLRAELGGRGVECKLQ